MPHILFKAGKISGYDTELTKVIAQKFELNLNFVQVKFGIYMKHNDSYSAGSANDMVTTTPYSSKYLLIETCKFE